MLLKHTVRLLLALLGAISIALLTGCKDSAKPETTEFHQGSPLTSFSQEITSPVREFTVKPGDTYTLIIAVKNTGKQPWYGRTGTPGVDASYRWVDAKGKELPIEGNRALLSRPVIAPGESDQLTLPVVAPPEKGSYDLWVSMVQEAVAWFYQEGTKPLVIHVTVQ